MSSSTDILTPDGHLYAYLVEPKALPAPVVVVIPEALGFNTALRAACDALAAQGFIAVCSDVNFRQRKMLETSAETNWPKAHALSRTLDIDKAVADVRAAIEQARAIYWCTGKVGVMGFGLGGLLTYLTAVRGGVDAGVCYYGGRIEEFLGESASLQGPLLLHQGDSDEFISPAAQAAIRKELAARSVEIHTYAGCPHGFAHHQGTLYDPEAASTANSRTVAFFRLRLWD